MGRKYFIVVILFFNIFESFGSSPLLHPDVEEIVLSSEDALELQCTGQKNVTVIYTVNPYCLADYKKPLRPYKNPCFQKPKITYGFDGKNHVTSFKREENSPVETGWYGCVEVDQLIVNNLDGFEWIGLTPENFKNSDVTWVYVYVNAGAFSFVEEYAKLHIIKVEESGDAFFPCTQISPALEPKFTPMKYSPQNYAIIDNDRVIKNIIHRSKGGFTMKNVTIADEGLYACYAVNTWMIKDIVEFRLLVETPRLQLDHEIMIDEPSEPIILGGTLQLNCTASISSNIYALRWKIPNKNGKGLSKYLSAKTETVTRSLTIERVTSEDEGEYECIYLGPNGIKRNSAIINLTLKNESLIFIPLEESSNVAKIYLEEKDVLKITCKYPKSVFIYPKNSINIRTSSAEIIVTSQHSKMLKRKNTVYGDSGWYGCISDYGLAADNLPKISDFTPYNYNNTETKWTYVYVKSNNNHFVQSLDIKEEFHLSDNENIILPCRPTSPEYKIKLLKDGQEVKTNNRIQFDPKRGFMLNNLTIRDAGYYQCVSEKNNQELHYYIRVTRNIVQYRHNPDINYSAEHLIVDGELRINCSIEHDKHVTPELELIIPNEDAIVSKKSFRKRVNNNADKSVLEMVMKNFAQIDEGEYTCTVTTFSRKKSVSTNVTFRDAAVEFRKLASTAMKRENFSRNEIPKEKQVQILLNFKQNLDNILSDATRQVLKNDGPTPN